MGQTILDGTNTDMSELAIVNSDGTIYPYQPYSEQNATVKMNALPVDDTTVGNHLWTANKINQFQAAVEGEIQQLETDLTGTVQGAIGDMNTAFTQKSAELDTKFDTLEGSIQTEQEAFETEIEGALASQKSELETEIGEVASDVQTLSGSVATQGQAITNLAGIVTSIDGRVDTLETDMAAAKSNISDLEASDAQQSSDITDLKGRMTTAEGEIDTLQTASEEHTTAISNLQAKDAELVGDINGLTTRIGSAEGDIDLLEGRADALETDVDNLKTDVTDLEENKADRVGYEKDLNVGAADMLIGNGTISDNKAYNFRRTGDGNQNVGNRLTDEIIGGTLVVNQLIKNGNFASNSDWSGSGGVSAFIADNKLTLTATSNISSDARANQAVTSIANHVYYCSAIVTPTNGKTNRVSLWFGANANFDVSSRTTIHALLKPTTASSSFRIYVNRNEVMAEGDTVVIEQVKCIDITQLFGSSKIADYVQNLETTTSGAGKAWLYEYFPILNGGYIPFNTGTLQSIVLSKHKLTEFNQWNEEWEQGIIGWTGVNTYDSDRIRSKDYIRVIPNTIYYAKTPSTNGNIQIFWYDSSRSFISYENSSIANRTFAAPSNAYYMRFYIYSTSYGTTYNHDICINFSGIRNGEYEPYNVHEYTFDSSKELRGIPKIDSNGKLYFDGDRYKDGVTRRYGIILMRDLTWTKDTTSIASFKANISAKMNGAFNLICERYPTAVTGHGWGPNMVDKTIAGVSNGTNIYVRDDTYSDAETFIASLGESVLLYELATPTTETATPIPNPQICSPDGTEEYIDPRVEAGTIPFAIPTGHETVYNTSLDFKLNQIPALPTTAGVYKLQVTVSSGVASYSWVAEV